MGIFNGRDLLSSKYPTAIIIDSTNTAHFFAIKNPIGEFFFAVVNQELYAFNVRAPMTSWRRGFAKTFGFWVFFTDNYNPLVAEQKELENILQKNDFPRMSLLLYKAMKLFSRKEKRKFEALEKLALIDALVKEKDSNPERYAEYEDLIAFLKDLPNDKVVTPVRRVTDYLDDTFLAPDPKFMGSVKTSLKLLLTENKEVNHVEITAKKNYMMFLLIGLLIFAVITALYFANEAKVFDNLGASIPGIGGGSGYDQKTLMAKYPTGPSLRAAVDSGELKYESLPKDVKAMVDKVPSPKLVPTP